MIIKQWNGSTFTAVYPEVTVSKIVASGTPSSAVFLRGDSTWNTPVNNYVSSLSGSGNSTLTVGRAGLTNLTVDLSHNHHTYDRASSVLSGASVFSNIVVSKGIITSIATRNLTAADLSVLPLAGGTMTGVLYPQNNTAYTTGQARRIILSTSNPSGGGNGDIWIKYV